MPPAARQRGLVAFAAETGETIRLSAFPGHGHEICPEGSALKVVMAGQDRDERVKMQQPGCSSAIVN